MNNNLIDKDSNFNIQQYQLTDKHINSQIFQDNDSDSSILNLLDTELSEKTPEETLSPFYSMNETTNYHNSPLLAVPDIRSESNDQRFEDLLLSKLPQIIAVDKASIQYEVHDQNYPCLSKSFKQCFNSPILDLLVVVLNNEKLVSLYQGYFAGTPKLANELINLSRKYWKSLISNNDEIAWENHTKIVTDKFYSTDSNEIEFEAGPVIRCKLKASTKQQFNQQFNYFFVQPCSYMVQLSQSNRPCQGYNISDTNSGTFMVSYINIMRECDTEFALKGSAAASLQKVITNTNTVQRMKLDPLPERSANIPVINQSRRTVNSNNNQLSIITSSPSYINQDKSTLNAPLTYPLINDQQYSKQRSQLQQHVSVQQRQSMPIMNNQYLARGVSINIVDPNQHHYQSHYPVQQSTSTLQYILENRNPHYPSSKQMPITSHPMGPQHGQPYQNVGRPNLPCYLPQDNNQSSVTNCSLSSPTTFLPARHLVPMSSSILLSSEQYFRNNHQINVIDSVQIAQPMMTVVRSMPSTTNNYFCSTAQNQMSQTPIHVINSMPHQNQFASSSLTPYYNAKNDLVHLNTQQYHSNGILNQMPVKKESEDIGLSKKDWRNSQIMDDSIATTFCGSLTSLPMTNDSISFEIVEEILKAEEAKLENKQNTFSISDITDQLSFDLDDFALLDRSIPNNSTANCSTQLETKHDDKLFDREYSKQSSNSSDYLLNLKSETLEKFTKAQKIGIKNFVNQQKQGKLSKEQMLHQINNFISDTLGKNDHYRQVIEYWNAQHTKADSSLSNLNCSHVVQSPEEGPGISPTEQAAQSTTDLEDDKDLSRHQSKPSLKRSKDNSITDLVRQRSRAKSSTISNDASIYRITSTTSTGVLETLLNEHDNPINADKSFNSSNFTSKLSVSSTPKHQLSLDQLLMDDECSMLSGFTPISQDDKLFKKTSDNAMRQVSSNIKSQPSTPGPSGNMGVLESLLNQKTPSMYGIRQKSTESILKHSKPSRQNSMDMLHEDSHISIDNNGLKKNSLLITLLNNSTGNTSTEKYSVVNSSTPCPVDVTYSTSQPKRQKLFSGPNMMASDNNMSNKKPVDKPGISGMDVFDFVDCEQNYNTGEFQSGTVTSSQSSSAPKTPQNKRNRKRCHSKEMSIDSDGSSDKNPLSVSNSIYSEKKVILTSLLELRKNEDSIMTTAPSIDFNNGTVFVQPTTKNAINYDDNIDLEDIKIDDFDLEHLIDISEQLEETNVNEINSLSVSTPMTVDSGNFSSSYSSNSYLLNNTPIYSMVTPVISISQSDPIVPVSKQSIIRLTDKNSILFSAIQSTSAVNSITVECLDSERERLLKQQQQQKVSIGGKYVSLNQMGTSDVDPQSNKLSHTLSLDLLSKQLKEVGPNVMVEPSNPVDVIRPRKSSCSRTIQTMSPLMNSAMIPSSPIGRSSSSSEAPSESSKFGTASLNNVNHQQVREGLRLLVSNRSAQNNSKNTVNNQRQIVAGFNEMMSPNSEFNTMRTSSSKSMIHYHSEAQMANVNKKIEPVTYPALTPNSNIGVIGDIKGTNILEDSLVNDVFELEELVNSKASKPIMENINFSKSSSDMSMPKSGNDTQMVALSSPVMNSSPNVNSQPNLRQPHHHHHLQHYHHHHQHHHHHTVPTSLSNDDTDNATRPTNKQGNNSNSGLLETLLSK